MGFNAPATLSLPAQTDVAVTLFRSATYPLWADQSTAIFYAVDGGLETQGGNTGLNSADVYLPAARNYFSWTTAARAPGGNYVGFTGPLTTLYPILGRDDNFAEFVYCPAGAKMYAVLIGYSAAAWNQVSTPFSFQVEQWNGPGTFVTLYAAGTVAVNETSGIATVVNSSASGGWYRIAGCNVQYTGGTYPASHTYTLFVASGPAAFTASGANAGQVAITPVAVTCHYPLVFPTEFQNSSLPWAAARVTAAAFLGTNVSQVLNKGGTILGGRLSPHVYPPFNYSNPQTRTILQGLHPAEKAFLPLETGVYSYAPPSTDLIFFGDYVSNNYGGAPMAPVFRLDNDSLYNRLLITASAVEEQLAVTATWHIEFRTSSALFQVALCPMTLEALHSAQLVLAETGFFFENPEHDKLLNKVIGTAKKYAPMVASAAGLLNPTAGRLLHSVVSKITPKDGPKNPKTTTAANSGMNGNKPKPKAKPKPKRKATK